MARRRSGVIFLIVGVLLAAVLVAGDRVAARVVENRVAAQLQTELGTPTRPKVDIEGFPFVTQVLGNSLRSVHLVADDASPPGEQQTLAHADLQLHDVSSVDRFQSFTAGSVDGTATLDYENAQSLSSQPIGYAREDRVSVTIQTTLLSVPVTATIVGRPVVNAADQTLTLDDPEINVAGVEVPGVTSKALLATLLKPIPIAGVPYGLQVTDVTAEPEGLVATVAGQNITFSR